MSSDSRKNKFIPVALFLAVSVIVSAYLHLRYAGFNDLDALYHYRHAAIYVQRGPFFTDFPWAQFSLIRTAASDLWYGFHLFLLPFTVSPDPVLGLKWGGAALLVAFLGMLYGAFRMLGVHWPMLWPFVILLSSPNTLWRLLMIRPQLLSLGLVALLLAATVRRGFGWVALFSFLLTFFHTTHFWLTVLTVGTVWLVQGTIEKRWEASNLGGRCCWVCWEVCCCVRTRSADCGSCAFSCWIGHN